MSHSPSGNTHPPEETEENAPSGQEEDAEGDVVMGGASDDSSEEPDEDEEEERRIREGFIVDEDEEEEDDSEERRRRTKRRKHRHRRRRQEEDLEEDDLELLEENTGTSFKKHRRLRRGGSSGSPAAPSRRKSAIETSESDLDNDDLDLPQVQDIQRIFDDERLGRDDYDDGDMDDFIEYDEEDEQGAHLNEEAREEKRQERRRLEKERRRAAMGRPELEGIDANAWDEIHDVFGDGHEYDWALEGEEEVEAEHEAKQEMKYTDVFEPTEIKQRMLTEDDDLIRAQDIPERMQLANSSLSNECNISLHERLTEADIDDAAYWVTKRISSKKTYEFFSPNGASRHMQQEFVVAVTFVLRCMFLQDFEVPYVWVHKRDDISAFDNLNQRHQELLSLSELWRIYSLGQKYRSLVSRRKALSSLYRRLDVTDEYFESDIQTKLDGVEVVADATEWLAMKYKTKKQDDFTIHFHDDDDVPAAGKRRKMPSRISAYEVAKKSIVSKLAQGFGIPSHHIVQNFLAANIQHFVEDQELNPLAYAEQFSDTESTKNSSPEELLQRARMIVSTELGKDPLLRQEIRELFKTEALITVVPTERGINKIDENHAYFNFKYLSNKRAVDMLESAQFLHILAAETELLVTVSIHLPNDVKDEFERRLDDAFHSDNFSDATKAWNEERLRIVRDVLTQHLLPAGSKWMREYIRDESEDFLAERCGAQLRSRIDVAPYASPHMTAGETPSVLAISFGKGDPHKDAITLVFLDEEGRFREQTKLDNLVDTESQDEFRDLLKRRRPDVIVIGGFTMATTKLSQQVKKIIRPPAPPAEADWGSTSQPNEQSFDIPVIYIHDAVARLYRQNKRAQEEFSGLSPIAKYCVGLARYAQSPLNEYAAMGGDISTIPFDEDDQQLIPTDKLLTALERTLVDVVNRVGVDVNRAVTDSYYQHLLPFVCGLGPRKAKVVVQRIAAIGGNLINRDQFIKNSILTTKLFLNAAGFLRIYQDLDDKPTKRHADDDVQDPLDGTRIHPEDYELARKMATDALEIDEEDIHDEHPSHVVSLIIQDPEKEKKLNDLNLDEFAVSLLEANNEKKRHTLNLIRDELVKPFAEQRPPFPLLREWDVLTMLSGESPVTLRVGLIISVLVLRIKGPFVSVRLDSGIEGIINSQYVSDEDTHNVTKGQTIPGVVIDVKMNLEMDSFLVELSSRQTDVSADDTQFRRVRPDPAWDRALYVRDQEMQARKKRAEMAKSRRVIKHPNFHNFNTSQAETFLDKQQRGDVIIRPSSKGLDHLAVTWKVEDKLFQHIDVTELNADPTGQTTGGELIVDESHRYADLDELIVNHVQMMARRVEELMAHEKFKPGSEDDLHLFLKNFVAANPSKSAYGFTLNRKKPGHFNLCFLANKNSSVQTWPIRVAPEAYFLFDAAAAGVPELCDAFKVRHLHESQTAASANAGGKTPYGGRTPARAGHATPGHMSSRTPGHMSTRAPGYMSVRQPARTPNPYSGPNPGGVPPASQHGGVTPGPVNGYAPPPFGGPNATFSAPPFVGAQPGYGGPGYGNAYNSNMPGYGADLQPPFARPPPPGGAPAGIHPSRLQMLQDSGSGWSG